MAIVTGLTAARMLEIEQASIVTGHVNADGELVLETFGGDEIEAGYVKGSRWGTTSQWVGLSPTNVPVAFADGKPAQVGDMLVSTNGYSLGYISVVTEVLTPTLVNAQELISIRGPAGTPAPATTLLTSGGMLSPAAVATPLSAWFAAATAQTSWVTFTAPTSGVVQVQTTFYVRSAVSGQLALADFEVRSGNTLGGGSVVRAAGVDTAVGSADLVNIRTQGGSYVSGLTPGSVYHARIMYFQQAANAVFTNTILHVITH